LLVALLSAAASADTKPVAYSAEMVFMARGITVRNHVWTDGVHMKAVSEDGHTVFYTDLPKNLTWQWKAATGCVPLPTTEAPGGPAPKEKEEVVGRETVDGHPTRKVKITTTVKGKAGTTTVVAYEWRATDLQDVPVRREEADGSLRTELHNVVLGKPDPAKMTSPCDDAAGQATALPAAPATAGYRTIPFFEAGCKQFVPLPLEMSIPSDYAVRAARPWGCFWGAPDDLDRVLTSPSEVDFSAIHRGVFYCRPSTDTQYDPLQEKFVNAAGPQENWPAAFAAQGIRDLVMTPRSVGGIATLRVSGIFQGKRVYMLYLGFGDSPAVLISYTLPAGSKDGAAEWARFLESVQAARPAPPR
jgi:hypothetical protein